MRRATSSARSASVRPDVRLAQPDRAHGRPGEQAGIVAKFVRALEHFDGCADRGRAGLVLTREDQRHAPHDQREERDTAGRVGRGERGGPFGGPAHGRGIAGEKGRVCRFGEHHDGAFRIGRRGPLGGSHKDLLPLGERSAVDGDVAAEVVDRDGQIRGGHVPARLIQQRHGPIGQSAEPGGVGRGIQQPALPGLFGRQQGRALERPGRDLVGAALARALTGLLQRRRGRVVGAEGGQREMPGPAVGFGVGQGAGQSAVQLPPPVGRGVAVDGGPGERVPELDPGIVHGDQARRLGGNQVGQVQPEHRRGAGQHRHLAAVDGGGKGQDVAGALRKSRQPHQVHAGDAGPGGERRVRRQVGQAVAFGAQLQERQRVPAGLAMETVGELLAQRRISLGAAAAPLLTRGPGRGAASWAGRRRRAATARPGVRPGRPRPDRQ